MNIKDVFEAFDYKISFGSDFEWFCWPDAKTVDFSKSISEYSAVYGSVTYHPSRSYLIYEVTLEGIGDNDVYRWVNPRYSDSYFSEYQSRGLDPDISHDDVRWINLSETEILEKVREFFGNTEQVTDHVDVDNTVDNRVDVELDLDDDVFMKLALEAHNRDITLNEMVELILKQAIAADIEHSEYWYDTERNKP